MNEAKILPFLVNNGYLVICGNNRNVRTSVHFNKRIKGLTFKLTNGMIFFNIHRGYCSYYYFFNGHVEELNVYHSGNSLPILEQTNFEKCERLPVFMNYK